MFLVNGLITIKYLMICISFDMNLDIALIEMRKAHKGQTRWDKKTPYEVHPIEVVRILRDMGVTDDTILCAGYLHDVLEDTDYSRNNIDVKFGKRVSKLVQELTNPSDDMTDEEYWTHINKMSTDAKIVKFADIIANTNDWSHHKHFYTKRSSAMIIILKDLITYRKEFA
jgi:(p)ppGpp synthase/HD superfamily hydrolase